MADNNFCSFVPDDETCQQNANPDMRQIDYDMNDSDMKDGDMKEEIMEANITFTMTALMNTAMIAASLFRYRSSATYYDAGAVLGTNYWQQYNQLSSYFWLGAFGIASVTQVLSLFGIANGVNILVWGLLLGGIGSLVELATGILMLLAWDKAYTIKEDTATNANDLALAIAVSDAVKMDMIEGTLSSITTDLALTQNSKAWLEYNMRKSGGDKKKGDKDGKMSHDGKEPAQEFAVQLMSNVINYVSF